MGNLLYQNPVTADAVLDSEVVSTDLTTGAPVAREAIVAQSSVFAGDPLTEVLEVLNKMLDELRHIKILLSVDVVPGHPEDVADEAELTEAVEEIINEGIEE